VIHSSSPDLEYIEITTARYPVISAYKIPDEYVTTVNDNIASLSFPTDFLGLSSGNYTFVTSNSAGWSYACGFTIPEETLVISVSGSPLLYNGIGITLNGIPIIVSSGQPDQLNRYDI